MTGELQHADDAQLDVLLFGDDNGNAYKTTLAHVESCETCQARLNALSGGGEFDAETRNMLRAYFTTEQAVDLTLESQVELDQFDYLDPPTHPEMLGRLGRYEIERVVGSGGMGVIFKGFDTELNRPVAIKVLAEHLAHVGAARQRFAREARAAAAVVHEHVLPIYNVETVGEKLFLVMPFVAGESLQSLVEREGALDVKQMLRIGLQASAALQAAHEQGVVHRDVKPGNILLDGGVERALVADFGLAQTVDDASLTRTGIVTGTPNYMSPEQASGKPVDARSDLFSLGSVLYFMATGRPPFRADKAMGVLNRICHEPPTPLWQLRPEIPDELSDLVDRLFEKNPAHRFTSAEQVHKQLQTILAGLQNPAPRQLVALRRWKRRHKRSLRIVAVSSCACLAIAVAAPALMRSPEAAQPESDSEYSETVWYQASEIEAGQWARSIQELNNELSQLEASDTAPSQPSTLNKEIQSLNQQLDEYQSNTLAH